MVTVDLSEFPVWNYTVTNPREALDPNWISVFGLKINAPITNVQSPEFWGVVTDNRTKVMWYSRDDRPYTRHIRPGSSLSGFRFESTASVVSAPYFLVNYDHRLDTTSEDTTSIIGDVQSPSLLFAMLVVTESELYRNAETNEIVVNFTIHNNGGGTATNVMLTAASLGGADGSPLTQPLGDIVPNDAVSTSIHFPVSAGETGAGTVLRLSGTYDGGTFNTGRRVTIP
jgi:hypothetical protein